MSLLRDWSGFLLLAAALPVYAAGVYLAWRALFRDRPRGRRRCPRCWHDLTHTPGMTCGECGFAAAAERDFGRTRRHWTLALLAIGLCLGMAVWLQARLESYTLASHLPTRVLIGVLRFGGEGNVHAELARRIGRDELTPAHWTALTRRAAAGDWGAAPASDVWIEKYSRWLNGRARRILADAEADWAPGEAEARLRIPAHLEVSARSEWPLGSTPHARLMMRDWWPMGADCRITVTPRLAHAEPLRFFRSGLTLPWRGHVFPIIGLPESTRAVELDVTVERLDAHDPAQDHWRVMAQRRFTLPIAFDRSAGPEPASGPALDAAVAAVFQEVVCWPSGRSPVRFGFLAANTYTPDFADTAVGVHVDLLHGSSLARRLDIWWMAGPNRVDRMMSCEPYEDEALLRTLKTPEGWSLRVTGDRDLALRAGDAPRYWAGAIEVPLNLTWRTGEALPQPWWTQLPPPLPPAPAPPGDVR